MTKAQAIKALQSGKNIQVTIHSFRGYCVNIYYLNLEAQYFGSPSRLAAVNHKIKCFKFDNAPVSKIIYEITN